MSGPGFSTLQRDLLGSGSQKLAVLRSASPGLFEKAENVEVRQKEMKKDRRMRTFKKSRGDKQMQID